MEHNRDDKPHDYKHLAARHAETEITETSFLNVFEASE